jgi:hypothetical protein
MGIEPTVPLVAGPLDLKSRRPTRTCPLPEQLLPETGSNVNILGRSQKTEVRKQETGDRKKDKGQRIKEKDGGRGSVFREKGKG